ncbi:zinc metalloprotease HtpX [archaeon]|jgi:heat shock protein HtpX|nr:zinc metalloprotease HtpX [archaeon]MBT6824061.1 zinc metalloprotease HtpX [archaeon]MBT7107094.1 zinc metalloprotease HtpX [archaeon]MBT7297706.1 zinc metalloprotease HtpX [archaeon]
MFKNQLKTTILLSFLFGVFLVIGYLLGGQSGLTIAFIFALVFNVISYWYSDKLVLKMYKAQPATKKEYSNLHKMVEEISHRAKIPKPKLYIVPDKNANAFATGRDPKHAVVAVTQGILELLNEEELKGVLAHEISHIKNRDMLISTIAAVIAGAISYLAFMARWAAIFGGRGDGRNSNIVELLALSILAPIMALIIRMAISRSREYIADESGAKLLKDSKPLARALVKLETSARVHPMKKGKEATAHMFIVNPFKGGLVKLFSTHPSTKERINRLERIHF